MAALYKQSEPLDFAMLKSISGATDGNLGAHIQSLEKAGYVSVEKEPIGRRTRTWVTISAPGKRAFREHLAFLEDIIGTSEKEQRK